MTTQSNPRAVLDKAIAANLGAVHTAAVCRVVSYSLNDGAPTADVRPVHRYRTNTGAYVDAPVLYDVPAPPLAWGDFVIHAPLKAGDYVLVLYCERSLDEWLEQGGTQLEAADPRRFSDMDAVILRKIDPASAPLSSESAQADALTLSKRDGSVSIVLNADGSVVVNSDDVRLGSAGASDAVALADALDRFVTLVDSTLTGWPVVAADGGASLKAAYAAARALAFPTGTIPSAAADKVKAE